MKSFRSSDVDLRLHVRLSALVGLVGADVSVAAQGAADGATMGHVSSAQLINQTSGATEYYTPQPILEAARLTMGGIDLDPASSARANGRVKAARYFTVDDDGLKQPWSGSIWLNHPFGRESNPLWIRKLLASYGSLDMRAACCLTFACTSEAWFRPLLDFPQCFLVPRTNYLLPDGSVKRGVTKGSVVTYLGQNTALFCEAFRDLGVVKVAADRILTIG